MFFGKNKGDKKELEFLKKAIKAYGVPKYIYIDTGTSFYVITPDGEKECNVVPVVYNSRVKILARNLQKLIKF